MKLPILEIEDATTEEKESPNGVYIPIPKGFKVPNGKMDGQEFEILVKASKDGDKLCLHSADGYELSPEGDGVMTEEVEEETNRSPDDVSDEESEKMTTDTEGEGEEKIVTEKAEKAEEGDDGESLVKSIQKFRRAMR